MKTQIYMHGSPCCMKSIIQKSLVGNRNFPIQHLSYTEGDFLWSGVCIQSTMEEVSDTVGIVINPKYVSLQYCLCPHDALTEKQ